jgi:histidine triad (HIT) family protein
MASEMASEMASGLDCVFCAIAARDEAASVIAEHDGFVAFLDARPLFKGHVLVIPRDHVGTFEGLPANRLSSLFGFVQRLCRAVEMALAADGTFVAMNNKVSQSVPHLHVHVVPRRQKDGLRGFFWPRARYETPAEREVIAERIRGALGELPAPVSAP